MSQPPNLKERCKQVVKKLKCWGSQDDSEIEPKTEPEVPVAREAQINTPPIPTVSPSTVSIAPTTTTIVSLQAPVLPEPSGSIVDTEEWGASAMPKSMTAPVMPSHISSHSSRTTAASRATAASRRLSTDPTLRFHEIARSLKDYTSAQSLSEVRSHQNPVKKLEGGCVSGLGLSIHIVRENDEPASMANDVSAKNTPASTLPTRPTE
ncbi:hypothetical protein FPQ18DRAFT_5513 [Pyronema domesticum]|uniref:Uncharacterized protein n=1 Tax=Pyronema omphalodes (strain CBS 100304) TaxID=1076935 RepID=U4L8A2_PYROM|nr:hypothetical protein FPQ18DRAFT_5513 [Pyronema domesticum]CCX14346.1 Protein of unknown function [Pyronema omphalodes CBS 100304]